MRFRILPGLAAAVGLTLVLAIRGSAQTEAPPVPPPPDLPAPQEGVDVQARGPVHEAFAEATDPNPQPGPVIAKQPPDPIDELPPDQKPDGTNVQWVPGYWAWVAESTNFLWVSGFWRDVPPGHRWVPGHWQQVQDGWQWVSGFWAPEDLQEVNYLPPPPQSIDAGPSTPAPDDTSTYVPGCWVFQQQRFLWRPGFWLPFQPGYVWTPARYTWTPVGCVFNEGYWDHPFGDRGLLFAPVAIAPRLLGRRWTYTPSYVVQPDFLLGALFVHRGTYHYYFGDYFEPRYARGGFVPWVDYRVARNVPDANFAYYGHEFRRDPGWAKGLRELYVARANGTVPRPPRTLVQQNQVIQKITVNKTQNVTVNKNVNITHFQNVSVLAPLSSAKTINVTHLATLGSRTNVKPPQKLVRMAPVPQAQRIQVQKSAVRLREVSQQRRQAEAKILKARPVVRPGQPPAPHQPFKVALPKPATTTVQHPPPPRPVPPRKPAPPPRPTLPKHVERPIPRPPVPPAKPPVRPQPPRPPMPVQRPPKPAPQPPRPVPQPPRVAPQPPKPAPPPPKPVVPVKPPAPAPHPAVVPHPPAPPTPKPHGK